MKADDLTGFVDYDRDKLSVLSSTERIAYFEKRVRLVVINPLARLLKTEIIVDGGGSSAILIFGVSLCCAIEAMGKFLEGRKAASGARFNAFVSRYMSAQFGTVLDGRVTYADALWKYFRNGIAHGFAVKHGGFEGTPADPYFQSRLIAGKQGLEINPSRLYADFLDGFERYIIDVRGAAPGDSLRTNFDDVFDAVFVRGE